MRKICVLMVLFFSSVIFANEMREELDSIPHNYSIDVSIRDQQCIIYMNDIIVYNTLFVRGMPIKTLVMSDNVSFGRAIGAYLQNGENELRIRILGY